MGVGVKFQSNCPTVSLASYSDEGSTRLRDVAAKLRLVKVTQSKSDVQNSLPHVL
jgi:hypothetical protein